MRFLIVFVPQRLQFLLATQIPEIQSDAVDIDGANVETDCRCDFSRIQPFVVFRKFRFGRLQIGLSTESCIFTVADVSESKSLTVLPALSRPRMTTQYSSFCVRYL